MADHKILFSKYKIRNISSLTMFIFGILAFLLGLLGIVKPETVLFQLGFEIVDQAEKATHDYTLVFMMTSSMASFNMGIYYILASLNNMKKFYAWTVPFRVVTFSVFTISVISGDAPLKFFAVALWELIGALATGMALYYEKK